MRRKNTWIGLVFFCALMSLVACENGETGKSSWKFRISKENKNNAREIQRKNSGEGVDTDEIEDSDGVDESVQNQGEETGIMIDGKADQEQDQGEETGRKSEEATGTKLEETTGQNRNQEEETGAKPEEAIGQNKDQEQEQNQENSIVKYDDTSIKLM